MDCHGPTDYPRNPAYPLLEGQYADYLVLQLELFAERRRGGSPYAPLMHHVVDRLDEQQMRDVAAFYASRSPSEALAP
jgi:cytochrome c553